MTNFTAVKIHYDHRLRLEPHLKYSDIPRGSEYQEYLDLYREKGIGGEGFDECLNFYKPAGEPVRIYLPPNYRPHASRLSDDFVIFSFTYQGDEELPSHIIGVHAGVWILSVDGIRRKGTQKIQGAEPLEYHAEAPAELVTLLNPPLTYNSQAGVYTPAYARWSNGLRYITETHAKKILDDALLLATAALPSLDASARLVTEKQIESLNEIEDRYFSTGIRVLNATVPTTSFPNPTLADKELGFLGEQEVYNKELEYVRGLGIAENEVEWVSQSDPSSTYDIKSVRKVGDQKRDHFIEVKSTKVAELTNIYVSANQIRFFKGHREDAMFKFVTFSSDRKVTKIADFSLEQLLSIFELVPIEYKLSPK
jgi:Domain of unknown function (DUF3883)